MRTPNGETGNVLVASRLQPPPHGCSCRYCAPTQKLTLDSNLDSNLAFFNCTFFLRFVLRSSNSKLYRCASHNDNELSTRVVLSMLAR